MKTFEQIKGHPYDASGIDNPNHWLWERINSIGVYYPVKKVSDEEIKAIPTPSLREQMAQLKNSINTRWNELKTKHECYSLGERLLNSLNIEPSDDIEDDLVEADVLTDLPLITFLDDRANTCDCYVYDVTNGQIYCIAYKDYSLKTFVFGDIDSVDNSIILIEALEAWIAELIESQPNNLKS